MKLRTLSVLIVLVLLLSACGDGDGDAATGGTTASTTTVPEGRGWLEGEELNWAGEGELAAPAFDEVEALGAGADTADAERSAAPGEIDGDDSSVEPLPPIETTVPDGPLQAGSIDDAQDVDAFLEYRAGLAEQGLTGRTLDLSDSTVFTVVGSNGLPVLDAAIDFVATGSDEPVTTLHTRADGSVRFLPHEMTPGIDELEASVRIGDTTTPAEFQLGDPAVEIAVDVAGGVDGAVPLDIHFVLDATGSMADEIARLRENMTSIAEQIAALPSAPDVRFGMTVYRDEGDLFVTRTFDLTGDLAQFLEALADVRADGGGDYPEALDEALADALEKPAWRREGAVELMFVVADAPPQVGRDVALPYTESAIRTAAAGAKIFPVAASGTDDQAESVMRDLAFVTGGRFVFLSYGVAGAATGGSTDITADDYDELPLDELVVRLVADELAGLVGDDTAPPTTTVVPTTTAYEQ